MGPNNAAAIRIARRSFESIGKFMGKPRKSPGPASSKCKVKTPTTPDPTPEIETAGPPRFSSAWMDKWLAIALATADIERACDETGVGIGLYLRARTTDPAFAMACLELDSILDLAAVASARGQAARGNLKAAKLVRDGLHSMATELHGGRKLPVWLAQLSEAVLSGTADPFIFEATHLAFQLAEALQRQGKPPDDWKPGEPWITQRFTASDVHAPDGHRYQCPACGAIEYRLIRLDYAGEYPAEPGWSSDAGWRCERCGARSGLPFQPAELPPKDLRTRQAWASNMRVAKASKGDK